MSVEGDFSLMMAEMVFWTSGGDGIDGGGDGAGSLRAIHDVISSVRPPDFWGESFGGSGSGLARGSTQLCHVGWERKAGLVGLVEYVDGLNTSSEPRESLGKGGSRAACLVFDELSERSISLRKHQHYEHTKPTISIRKTKKNLLQIINESIFRPMRKC